MMSKLLLILFSFLLISCQVEKKSGGDDYIADHRTANNSFTLKTSQSGVFKTGNVLSFTLSFPSNIIVTGNPRLALEIGNNTRYATLASGAGTKALTFKYTIIAGDNDDNGIRFLNIDLNGGALQFYLKEELTHCSTALKAIHYSKILIDNTSPYITSISHTHLSGSYYKDDELTFTVQFSEKVFVTGNPTLRLGFNGGVSKEAKLFTGSGSDNLTFKYKIEQNVVDSDGITWNAAPITLNGGTIKDASQNTATNSRPDAANITATIGLKINGQVPKLLDVILPADGTYQVSQHLDFALQFDRSVSITGAHPQLTLTVGPLTQYAELLPESINTDTLVFRYTPLPGHVDLDGISLTNTISNAASINALGVSMTTLTGNNDLKNKNTSKIIVNSVRPSIERITRGTDTSLNVNGVIDNVWIIGQSLIITAEFNTKIIVNIQNGSPTLQFKIGEVSKVASYLTGGEGSDTMAFTYTIAEGDESIGSEITIDSILLNNAVVLDEAGTVADFTLPHTTITNTTIDGIRPKINELLLPANGSYSNYATTAAKRYLQLGLRFSEPVNLSNSAIGIDILVNSGGPVRATHYATDVNNNNRQDINFRYNIASNIHDDDGISIQSPLNMGAHMIKDIAGNTINTLNFPTSATPAILIDNTRPKVASINEPTSGLYLKNGVLTFELVFDEVVTINSVSNYPRIPITNMSPTTRYLSPTFSGLRTGTHFTFSYTVQNGDYAATAIRLGNLTTSGSAYIRDEATSNFTNVPLDLNNIITIDAAEVEITGRTGPVAGYYQLGEELNITLNFSEKVTVDDTNGTPSVTAQVGGVEYEFLYNSGSESTTLTFTHTITNQALRLSGLGKVSSLSLNGGTIRCEHEIDANLTFTELNLNQVKILPQKFLAWANGSLLDIISETTIPFYGSLNLNGSNSLGTSKSPKVIITQLRFQSSAGAILGDIDYYVVDGSLVLRDKWNRIQSLRVNNSAINAEHDEDLFKEYYLGFDENQNFTLEIELVTPITGEIMGSDFMGQITSILLLDSSLDATERTAVYVNEAFF